MSSDVKHKTKGWYVLTHWDRPKVSYCGEGNIFRWHWKYVNCEKCLEMRGKDE
jgi:hypothetical protein